jgi:TetR/AcrR family transcriptional repressor of nem operon
MVVFSIGRIAMPRLITGFETGSRILDVAERLVQTRGFNAFSYADIAAELHVTKASLHYHFATKADLGRSLIERYSTSFVAALDRIARSEGDAGAKLQAYVDIYADVLDNGRMCLCGMLAAEYATLPASMQDGVRRFFETNEAWLVGMLTDGRDKHQLTFTGEAVDVARVLIAALEGAMLLVRSGLDTSHLRSVARRLMAELGIDARAEVGN